MSVTVGVGVCVGVCVGVSVIVGVGVGVIEQGPIGFALLLVAGNGLLS